MGDNIAAAACIGMIVVATSVRAAEVPRHTFFSGNDVYDWCQYDRKAATSYVAGLFDQAAHAAAAIDERAEKMTGTIL
jgi:hypothetical protein